MAYMYREYRPLGTPILRYSSLRYHDPVDWAYLLIIPLAIAGWVGISFLTRRASNKNAGWESPVPRAPGSRRWRWPWSR